MYSTKSIFKKNYKKIDKDLWKGLTNRVRARNAAPEGKFVISLLHFR